MSFKGLKANKASSKDSVSSDSASFKLVMVGDSGVGKSCLLEKLLDISSKNTFISTIGVDVRSHVLNWKGNAYKLQVKF